MIATQDEVTFSRLIQIGAADSLGRKATATAPGFPAKALGSFQMRERQGEQEREGIRVIYDAVFYSHLFSAGMEGDIVTPPAGYKGPMIVVAAILNDGGGMSIGHTTYLLRRTAKA